MGPNLAFSVCVCARARARACVCVPFLSVIYFLLSSFIHPFFLASFIHFYFFILRIDVGPVAQSV